MDSLTRRGFIKTAGSAAGAMIAAGVSRSSYASNSRIRVGMIGTGGQGCKHIEYGIRDSPQLQLAAICEVYRPHREAAQMLIDRTCPDEEAMEVVVYNGDYRDMLDGEQLDAVVISTPPDTHYGIVMECLNRGLHVFCEKVLALDIDDARAIVTRCHETKRICQVGHQRRYNPVYNTALWIARETPVVGRIHHVASQWHRNDDWRRYVDPKYTMDEMEAKFIEDLDEHLNWRVYRARGGDPMTELGTHQSDIATWFLGAPPSRVVGYGGCDYWRDGRDTEDNLSVVFEYDIARSAKSFQPPQPRTLEQKPLLLTKPYQVRFDYSITMANAKRGNSDVIFGDNGTLELSEANGGRLYSEAGPLMDRNALYQMRSGDHRVRTETSKSQGPQSMFTEGIPIEILEGEGGECLATMGHREIDMYQFQSFAKDILEGITPKANEFVGLLATISGVAAVRAVRERRAVEIDPAWYTFDFETPDPYRYDRFPSPRIHENCVDAFPRPILESRGS